MELANVDRCWKNITLLSWWRFLLIQLFIVLDSYNPHPKDLELTWLEFLKLNCLPVTILGIRNHENNDMKLFYTSIFCAPASTQYSSLLMGSKASASTFCRSFFTTISWPVLPFRHSRCRSKTVQVHRGKDRKHAASTQYCCYHYRQTGVTCCK